MMAIGTSKYQQPIMLRGADADKSKNRAGQRKIDNQVFELNAALDKTFKDQTITNEDGTTTSISFDMNAQYKEKVSEGDLKDGENIIEIDNNMVPGQGNGRTVWEKRDKTSGENPINKNDKMWLHTRHSYVNSFGWVSAATHEVGHTLGLNDRYSGDTGSFHEGFENDLMGSGKYNLVPAHYIDWSQHSMNLYNQNQQGRQKIVNYIDLHRKTAPKR